MTCENNIQDQKTQAFTVRINYDLQNMIEFLKKRTMLSKSSIIRFAVAELYKKEYNKLVE